MPNKSLIYKKLPTGYPVPGEHLAVEARPFDLEAPAPEGGLVLEMLYSSFDPYLRGKMRDPKIPSYTPAFELEQPIYNYGVGRVIKSDTTEFAVGDIVVSSTGCLPIAEYAVVAGDTIDKLDKVNNPRNIDLGHFIGALGMPGLTGYSGLHRIGQPKKGETIFVSSAAGAVGQMVGQIAKLEGLTVIGSVGSDEKLDFITKELGFDSGFNYKKESAFDALPRLAPQGIDIYFDNVGGEQLEAAIANMNKEGRIALCGSIASTSSAERPAIRGIHTLVGKMITMRGFLVFGKDFGPYYGKEHQEKVQGWIADGSMKAKLHVTEGIDKAAEALVGIFHGDNFGKAVVKIR